MRKVDVPLLIQHWYTVLDFYSDNDASITSACLRTIGLYIGTYIAFNF